jgi:predicted lipoprotein with Yx(FWY)xxD motif
MRRLLIPATFLVAMLAAACTTGAGATPVPPVATPVPATVTPPSVAPSVAANGPTVSVSTAGYFVGPNGMSLYAFDKDAANTSNCQSGQCLANWPALAPSASGTVTVGTGLSATDFATIARQDGSMQVTFKTVPLYFFVGDKVPGDTKGDGVAGIWHLATVNTTAPVASSAPSTAPSSAPASSAAKECTDPKTYQTYPCPSSAAASPAAGGGTTVALATGGYLAGPNGLTLYTFDKDTSPGTSVCSADCATNWPALTIPTGATIAPGAGLDAEDFTTFTRSDGTIQVAYYGKPLYYFAGDHAAGDTSGDGVAGIWHEAKPQ